jgi:chemotaxis protein MotB
MNRLLFGILIIVGLMTTSCVSKKKLKASQSALTAQQRLLTRCENRNADLEKQLLDLNKMIDEAKTQVRETNDDLDRANLKLKSSEEQFALLKTNNTNLLDQLNTLSVINRSGAESIKKSLDAINQQSQYIKDLTKSMQYKDSVNLALALNLKRSLGDFNDKDVTIEVKKGVVYISLSDNMLFKTGSAAINSNAETVLAKIAGIVNDHRELDILVEGHTDNIPMSGECIGDNWELSARRAVSIVRLLQNKYKVEPSRMTAGGRSEYVPKGSNTTPAGRSENRRTEIIILPKLEQFFKLMEINPDGKK